VLVLLNIVLRHEMVKSVGLFFEEEPLKYVLALHVGMLICEAALPCHLMPLLCFLAQTNLKCPQRKSLQTTKQQHCCDCSGQSYPRNLGKAISKVGAQLTWHICWSCFKVASGNLSRGILFKTFYFIRANSHKPCGSSAPLQEAGTKLLLPFMHVISAPIKLAPCVCTLARGFNSAYDGLETLVLLLTACLAFHTGHCSRCFWLHHDLSSISRPPSCKQQYCCKESAAHASWHCDGSCWGYEVRTKQSLAPTFLNASTSQEDITRADT